MDERAHAVLLELLLACGNVTEAREHYRAHKRWLEGRGERPGAVLLQAYAEVNASAFQASPEPAMLHGDAEKPAAQKIQFCTTSDGVRIAYATIGTGPPLLKTANWLNHLEFDWHSEVWRHWLKELSRDHCLVRYDERGNGLSDWEVSELSLPAFVDDMETVVDALGLERCPVLGISQGAAVAAAYAARHPERVSHLILVNGFSRGWRLSGPPIDIDAAEAMIALARAGWGKSHPAFRQVFTSLYFPEASGERMQAFNELQRRSTSPRNAVRLFEAFGTLDATEHLGKVQAPTLVLHCRHDGLVPFAEGLRLAKWIPGARFVPLESRNHLVLEDEPAWDRLWSEIRGFLGSGNTRDPRL
jgi:pimeloyl-ACP methyl ester carboxylesterase